MKAEHKEIFLSVMHQIVKEFFEGEGFNGFYSKENKSVAYFTIPEIKKQYRRLVRLADLKKTNVLIEA